MIAVTFMELNLYYEDTLTSLAEAIFIFNDNVTNLFYSYPDESIGGIDLPRPWFHSEYEKLLYT